MDNKLIAKELLKMAKSLSSNDAEVLRVGYGVQKMQKQAEAIADEASKLHILIGRIAQGSTEEEVKMALEKFTNIQMFAEDAISDG